MSNQKVKRVQTYLSKGLDYRRWRMWSCIVYRPYCIEDKNDAFREAEEVIDRVEEKGFRGRIYAPLPVHKNSGHVHIVILATFDEYSKLALGGETPNGSLYA